MLPVPPKERQIREKLQLQFSGLASKSIALLKVRVCSANSLAEKTYDQLTEILKGYYKRKVLEVA